MIYASIDVETTGLCKDINQLLEVGVVIDNGSPFEKLPSLRIVVVRDENQFMCTPYIMDMHRTLFKEIVGADQKSLSVSGSYENCGTWYCRPYHIGLVLARWLKQFFDGKVTVAGKNFYAFDYGFLSRYIKDKIEFRHRALDPLMYYIRSEDVKPPNMQLCCERAGIELKNHHTAVGDAMTVVRLIRCGQAV